MGSSRSGSTGVIEVKGDILAFDGTDLDRLPVGADGTILRSDSAQPQGLKWDTPDDIPGIGIPLVFGGNFVSAATQGRYHRVNGTPEAPNVNGLSSQSEAIVIKAGRLTRFGWVTDAADATTVYKVWVNGLVAGTYNLTGTRGVLTGLGLVVAQSDIVAVEYDAGLRPLNSHVQLFIE
jgi:hypothetical protein